MTCFENVIELLTRVGRRFLSLWKQVLVDPELKIDPPKNSFETILQASLVHARLLARVAQVNIQVHGDRYNVMLNSIHGLEDPRIADMQKFWAPRP